MTEHRAPYTVAGGGAGVSAISSSAAQTALPTIVCVHCDRMVRIGNQLISHGLCDGCLREFLDINGVEVAA